MPREIGRILTDGSSRVETGRRRNLRYAFGSFGGYLCRFDAVHAVCFNEALSISRPNVGAVLGNAYYYAKNLGKDDDSGGVYYVQNIKGDAPKIREDASLEIDGDLFSGAVYDFAPIVEDGREVFDDKYDKSGRYLVGLASDYSLLVIHVDEDSGAPDSYLSPSGRSCPLVFVVLWPSRWTAPAVQRGKIQQQLGDEVGRRVVAGTRSFRRRRT